MDAIIQIILAVIGSLLTFEGGKYGVKRIRGLYNNTEGDVYSEQVCKLRHEQIDSKLDDIAELIEKTAKQVKDNATQIHSLALAQEKMLAMDGPIHNVMADMEDRIEEKVLNISSTPKTRRTKAAVK